MTKATMPKMLVIIVIGVIAGLWAQSSVRFGGIVTLVSVVVLLGFFGYVAWLLIFANKKVRKADSATRKAALRFEAVPDKAVVYVYRSQFVGKLMGLELLLDGDLLGQTRGGCFFRLEVTPGRHELSGNKKCTGNFAFEAAAGDVLYVQQELLMGALKSGYHYRGAASVQEVGKAQSDIKGCAMYLPQQS